MAGGSGARKIPFPGASCCALTPVGDTAAGHPVTQVVVACVRLGSDLLRSLKGALGMGETCVSPGHGG